MSLYNFLLKTRTNIIFGIDRLWKRIICKLISNDTEASQKCSLKDILNGNYFALILILSFTSHKQIREGTTITVVNIKKIPQSPFSQSTRAPEDEARVVLLAVHTDASKAY